MGKIGEILRKTREAKGLTLQQVEDETNMRWKYIEALEEENYEVIPGQAYVRGFLRNYSAFLGLDPEEMLEQYKASTEKAYAAPKAEEDWQTKRTGRKNKKGKQAGYTRLVVIGVAVAVLVGGGWLLWAGPLAPGPKAQPPNTSEQTKQNKPPAGQGQQTDPSKTPAQPGGQVTPPPQPPATVTPPTQPPATLPQGVDLTLKANGGQSWIAVFTDGQKSFEGFLNNGETKNFTANNKIAVRYGNAGVVEVIHQGKSLGKPGGVGKVVNKEYTR
ncbi:MAG: DUF4115 domain-containing protein [Clostridia bacterium]|nr:DUF4115 domain-containing protein [Bacillota bacterium]MDA8211058.1 DUF4115 domain-containing protein [Clostridia bacterium]